MRSMNEHKTNKHWYVLYVNVRHEKKVFEKLQEQAIESYLPIVTRMKQWSDRKKRVEEPLFTGYVFVKLLEHELDKPLYVSGVLNYLSFGKKKAIVKQSEIDNLQYLNILNIQNNKLINLPTSLYNVKSLQVLNLSNNTLNTLNLSSIKTCFPILNEFWY